MLFFTDKHVGCVAAINVCDGLTDRTKTIMMSPGKGEALLPKLQFYRFYSVQEEFEDIKGVIRIRISKKNRQHNGQKKKYKRTNNDLQNIHIKLKIE
jgi:hypothetical protein